MLSIHLKGLKVLVELVVHGWISIGWSSRFSSITPSKVTQKLQHLQKLQQQLAMIHQALETLLLPLPLHVFKILVSTLNRWVPEARFSFAFDKFLFRIGTCSNILNIEYYGKKNNKHNIYCYQVNLTPFVSFPVEVLAHRSTTGFWSSNLH